MGILDPISNISASNYADTELQINCTDIDLTYLMQY